MTKSQHVESGIVPHPSRMADLGNACGDMSERRTGIRLHQQRLQQHGRSRRHA